MSRSRKETQKKNLIHWLVCRRIIQNVSVVPSTGAVNIQKNCQAKTKRREKTRNVT